MVGAAQITYGLATLLFLAARSVAVADERRDDSNATVVDAHASPLQCEARTINYITHTLPQYCLTSTWTSSTPTADTTHEAGGNSTAGVTAAGDAAQHPEADSTPTPTPTAAAVTPEPDERTAEELATQEAAPTSFMSFEDWKEMMLRQAGQDPQDLRHRRQKEHASDDRTPPDLGHSGLGEEDEISLNFDAYTDTEPRGNEPDNPNPNDTGAGADREQEGALTYEDGKPAAHRSKDAGKTCKERFSYSSFDAGATILKTNPGAKNARAILVENKDSYMLLECGASNKFIIVELSDDVLVDTIVLANFEFFSSMVRHFRLSVSDRYPVKIDKWRELGTFEARNSRDIQAFLVENPQIWAKYVRIEFLTHFGNEYYCPVSLLRVHGSRLLDSWKEDEPSRDEEALLEDGEAPQGIDNIPDQNAAPDPEVGKAAKEDAAQAEAREAETASDSAKDFEMEPESTSPWPTRPDLGMLYMPDATCAVLSPGEQDPMANKPDPSPSGSDEAPYQNATIGEGNQRAAGVPIQPSDFESTRVGAASTTSSPSPGTSSTSSSDERATASPDASNSTSTTAMAGENANATNSTAPANKTSTGTSGKGRSSGTSSGTAASPTVQQGFFNAITQRLQQVEANLTLSLKYVEEQSRHMQEALQRAEQKHSSKVNLFLDDLNRTVLAELRTVRDQYEQIWQSTIIALDSQRDHSERDNVALSTRLNILADEVVFQKRMAIVQAVLLLSCLFLVIFSRGVTIPYLAPLLEQTTAPSFAPSSSAALDARSLYRARADPETLRASKFRPDPPARNGHVGIALSPTPDNLSPVAEVDPEPVPEPAEYRHLSPPLSPSPSPVQADIAGSETNLSSYDSDMASLSRLPSAQSSHSRKPLPALPEHPGSP